MNKLNYAILVLAIVSTGCTSSNSINGTYISDKVYEKAIFTDSGMDTTHFDVTPDQTLHIEYPEALYTFYGTQTDGDGNTKASPAVIQTNLLKKINNELYISTSIRGGHEIIIPLYVDEENECIYGGGYKLIKKR